MNYSLGLRGPRWGRAILARKKLFTISGKCELSIIHRGGIIHTKNPCISRLVNYVNYVNYYFKTF